MPGDSCVACGNSRAKDKGASCTTFLKTKLNSSDGSKQLAFRTLSSRIIIASAVGIFPTLMYEMTHNLQLVSDLHHQRSSGLRETRIINVRNIGGMQQQLFNSFLSVAGHQHQLLLQLIYPLHDIM